MKYLFKQFRDITSFYNELNTGTCQKAFNGRTQSDSDDADFTGTPDYSTAEYLLFHGDKNLADEIEKNGVSATRLKLQRSHNRPRFCTSVQGFAPHVQNYLAGRPNAMITRRDTQEKARVLSIAYNIGVSCSISAENMMHAAAKFVSAAMQIEAGGIRLNISTCDFSEKDETRWGFDVRIKSAGQAFDVLKMAFPLAHPSMLRRISFKHTEITAGVPKSAVSGYGRPLNTQQIKDSLSCVNIHHDVVLSYHDIVNKTTDEVINMILGAAK